MDRHGPGLVFPGETYEYTVTLDSGTSPPRESLSVHRDTSDVDDFGPYSQSRDCSVHFCAGFCKLTGIPKPRPGQVRGVSGAVRRAARARRNGAAQIMPSSVMRRTPKGTVCAGRTYADLRARCSLSMGMENR